MFNGLTEKLVIGIKTVILDVIMNFGVKNAHLFPKMCAEIGSFYQFYFKIHLIRLVNQQKLNFLYPKNV